jgi:hypothetical protein
MIAPRGVDSKFLLHHDALMRTTLDINDALLKELRKKAAQAGRPFRSVVEETLALGLARKPGAAAPGKKFRVKAHPLNIKPGFRGTSFNQIYDQLEAEDAAK